MLRALSEEELIAPIASFPLRSSRPRKGCYTSGAVILLCSLIFRVVKPHNGFIHSCGTYDEVSTYGVYILNLASTEGQSFQYSLL